MLTPGSSRRIALPALVLVIGAACAGPPPPRAPAPDACADSLYLELSRTHPDSLSERAWTRLGQLDSACQAQQRAAEADAGWPGADDAGPDDHHIGRWLWMPVMMVAGGMMWLMMGGGW